MDQTTWAVSINMILNIGQFALLAIILWVLLDFTKRD